MDMTENMQQKLDQGKHIAVFTADWCPDCQAFKPLLDELMQKYSDLSWVIVDRDEHMDIAQKYGVMGIPCLLLLNDGEKQASLGKGQRLVREEVIEFLENINK